MTHLTKTTGLALAFSSAIGVGGVLAENTHDQSITPLTEAERTENAVEIGECLADRFIAAIQATAILEIQNNLPPQDLNSMQRITTLNSIVPCFIRETSYEYEFGVSPDIPRVRHAAIETPEDFVAPEREILDAWGDIFEHYFDLADMMIHYEDKSPFVELPLPESP